MSEFEKESQKLPVFQVVLNNLKYSVQLEEKLLNDVQKMENMGLSATVEYKQLKLRQFEESFFALFLLRLTRSMSDKKINQTYLDVVKSFKSRMSTFRKQDKDGMRKEYSKMKYAKKMIHESIDKSYEKSKKYIELLENELKNVEK